LQHQLVFDALQRGESARVEMLMREHAWVGQRYGALLGAGDNAASA
jgi:GntR family transcriptional regulator of vanillate catabolism